MTSESNPGAAIMAANHVSRHFPLAGDILRPLLQKDFEKRFSRSLAQRVPSRLPPGEHPTIGLRQRRRASERRETKIEDQRSRAHIQELRRRASERRTLELD